MGVKTSHIRFVLSVKSKKGTIKNMYISFLNNVRFVLPIIQDSFEGLYLLRQTKYMPPQD